MNVYRVTPFAKPPGKKFQYYAQLGCSEADRRVLSPFNFTGRPFPKKWPRPELFFEEPLLPRADFCYAGMGIFACTERVKGLLGNVMAAWGEFLPIDVEGEEGDYFIYNVTNLGSCIEPVRSIWKCDTDDEDELRNPMTALLESPAFDPKKIKTGSLLKIPEDSEIYCAELTAHPQDNEFKALVEHHELKGLEFELAWNEMQGPVPKGKPPGKGRDFVWMTGDGRRFGPG